MRVLHILDVDSNVIQDNEVVSFLGHTTAMGSNSQNGNSVAMA